MSWLIVVIMCTVAVWMAKDVAVIELSLRGADQAERDKILRALHDTRLASRPVIAAWRWWAARKPAERGSE